MLFRTFDLRTGTQSYLQAFDMNGARRSLKRANKWNHIPKKVLIHPVSQTELEAMLQKFQESQTPENPNPGGVQLVNEAEEELTVLEGKVESIMAEAEALEVE